MCPAVSAFVQGAAELRQDAADSSPGGPEHRDEMVDERLTERRDELPQEHQPPQDAFPLAASGAHCQACWDCWAAASAAVEI